LTSLTIADSGVLQPPRIASVQHGVTSAGQEVAEFSRRLGQTPDPWQELAWDATLQQDSDGYWAANETGLVAGRQTGKNGFIEPIEGYGLFVLGEQILHTVHRGEALRALHYRFHQLLRRDPVLRRRIEKTTATNEEHSILLDDGAKIRFAIRSDEGARSQTYDRVVMDEGFAATAGQVGAVLPTLISKANWQINWLSSAGMARSLQLHRLRRRARLAEVGVTYLEWSADPERFAQLVKTVGAELARLDHGLLGQALPALVSGRLKYETVEALVKSLDPAEAEREILCLWDEPESAEAWLAGITEDQWKNRFDPQSRPLDPVAFVVDVTRDRSRTAIGMAAWRADGRRTVEVIEERPGTGWAPARLGELARQWDPCVVAMDDSGPAGGLREAIVDEGLDVEVLTARMVGQAHGRFVDGVRNDQVRHRGDARLTEQLRDAGTRKVAEAQTWAQVGDTPVHVIRAVSFADFMLARHGRTPPPPPPPRVFEDTGSETGDLMKAGF